MKKSTGNFMGQMPQGQNMLFGSNENGIQIGGIPQMNQMGQLGQMNQMSQLGQLGQLGQMGNQVGMIPVNMMNQQQTTNTQQGK